MEGCSGGGRRRRGAQVVDHGGGRGEHCDGLAAHLQRGLGQHLHTSRQHSLIIDLFIGIKMVTLSKTNKTENCPEFRKSLHIMQKKELSDKPVIELFFFINQYYP